MRVKKAEFVSFIKIFEGVHITSPSPLHRIFPFFEKRIIVLSQIT